MCMLPRSYGIIWLVTWARGDHRNRIIFFLIRNTNHSPVSEKNLVMVDFLDPSVFVDYVVADPITFVIILVVAYLSIRVMHRLYYLFEGHVHHTNYHPRQEMLLFLKKKDILMTEHSFICKRDKVSLRYRKIGTGPKVVLLNNGVGTDFYMWLPTLTGDIQRL